MNPITLFLLWTVSMFWHLWRIATLRPDFHRLSDGAGPFFSFAAVFLFAGVVRHTVFGDMTIQESLFGLLVWAACLVALFERNGRSSALCYAMLGASAATDFLVIIIELIGLGEEVGRAFWLGLELLIMWSAWRSFHAMPADVKASGYRRKAQAVDAA